MSLLATTLTIEQLSQEGNKLFKNGEYTLSSACYEKLLNLRAKGNKQNSTNDKSFFVTMNNLAMSYVKEKRYIEAEHLLTELYSKRIQCLGKDHIDTLQSLFDLSSLLSVHFNQDDRASSLLVEYLSAIQSNNSQENKVLVAMTNLASIYYRQDKLEKSCEILRSIITKRKTIQLQYQKSTSPSTSVSTSTSSSSSTIFDINIQALMKAIILLADINFKLESYIEADKWYQEDIDYKNTFLGPSNQNTINSLINYSNFLQKLKNYSLSLTTYLNVFTLKKSLHNNNVEHDEVYPLLYTIGQLYYIQTDYKHAISYYQQYSSILQRKMPTTYQQMKEYQKIIIHSANSYYHLKQYREAVSVFDEIKMTFKNGDSLKYNINSTDNLTNMNTLACLYSELNINIPETELLYISCLQGRYKLLGETHAHTINTLHNLCQFYKISKNCTFGI